MTDRCKPDTISYSLTQAHRVEHPYKRSWATCSTLPMINTMPKDGAYQIRMYVLVA